MTALPQEKLDKLVQRWEEIQADLNRGAAPSAYVQLTKEYSDLSPVVESIRALRRLEDEQRDLRQLLGRPRHRPRPQGPGPGGAGADRPASR